MRLVPSLGPSYVNWWASHTASQLGMKFGLVAFPVIAVQEVNASALDMGFIGAAESIAYLLFALPAGAQIESLSKRAVVSTSGVARLLACFALFYLALSGNLGILVLALFALTIGVCSVFFDISLAAGLPERVPEGGLEEANRGFEVAQQFATFAGPALAGVMIAVSSAEWVIAFDGVLFLIASGFALRSRSSTAAISHELSDSFLQKIILGVKFCWAHPILRRIFATLLISNFAATVIFTLQPIIILRTLSGTSLDLAFCMILGSIGGVGGAFSFKQVRSRLARAPLMVAGLMGAAFSTGGIVLASVLSNSVDHRLLIVLCGIAQFGVSFSIVHFSICQVSFRQEETPANLMSRMSSVARLCVWGPMPLASLLAGWSADVWGLQTVLVVAFVATCLTVLPVIGVGKLMRARDVATT